MKHKVNYALLLLGIFAETQIRIVGLIGISEFFIFLMAPFLFFADYGKLKRNGFCPLLFLGLLTSVGCIVSSWLNQTYFQFAIRGFASTYALFAVPVVLHHYLSRDLGGLRWYLVGLAISGIITIFGFHNGVEQTVMEKSGGDVMASELFLARHFGRLFALPYEAWYLQTPFWISVVLVVAPVAYTVITTSSGRSMLMVSLLGLFLMCYARRSRRRMQRLRSHLVAFCIASIFCSFLLAAGYKVAAKNGLLNEKAQLKYERQSSAGSGPLALLMRGRAEFFVGIMACLDKPLAGYGPWAFDEGHYWESFTLKYGTDEDMELLATDEALRRRLGLQRWTSLIPAHSHIVGFWLWYGVLGLPFWFYVLKKCIDYFRFGIDAVPQWFGFVAVSLPALIWNIFFSPYTGRMTTNVTITCILLALAVAQGKIKLPIHMQREIMKG